MSGVYKMTLQHGEEGEFIASASSACEVRDRDTDWRWGVLQRVRHFNKAELVERQADLIEEVAHFDDRAIVVILS